jgi:hypothetical protein
MPIFFMLFAVYAVAALLAGILAAGLIARGLRQRRFLLVYLVPAMVLLAGAIVALRRAYEVSSVRLPPGG